MGKNNTKFRTGLGIFVILFFLTHAIPIVLPACFGRGYSSFSVKDPLVLQKVDNLPKVENATISASKKVISVEPSTNRQADQILALQSEIDNLRKNDRKLWVSFLVFAAIIMVFFIILLRLLSKSEFSRPNKQEINQKQMDDNRLYDEFVIFKKNINNKIVDLEFQIKKNYPQSSIQKSTLPDRNSPTQRVNEGVKSSNSSVRTNVYNAPPVQGGNNVNQSSGEDFFKKLIQQYNNATQFEEQRRFEDNFKPIRLGVNPDTVIALSRGEAVEVSLEDRPDGDYWAIDISKYVQYSNAYFIIPRFFPFDDTVYKAGAMGKVFDCINFNPRYRFNYINLIKPALVTEEGSSWKIKSMGQIRLEQGEQIS